MKKGIFWLPIILFNLGYLREGMASKPISKNWPLFSTGITIGNRKSNVAVCTLSSEISLPKKDIAVVGMMRTQNLGIERMIQNVLSNTYIRYIVLCGRESKGHMAGDSLLKLWENGVNSKGKIINSSVPMAYIQHLDKSMINRFRKQIEIVNMIGVVERDKIMEKVKSLEKKKPFGDAVELKGQVKVDKLLAKPDTESYITPHVIYSETISDAWYRAAKRVWSAGNIVERDDWNSNIKEVQNLVVLVENPLKKPMHNKHFNWSKERLEEYSKEYLTAEKGDFEYTYGERMTHWGSESLKEGSFAIDQIREVIIPSLRSSPRTRRAIAITLNPQIDIFVKSPPCMVLNQFLLRNKKIHLTTYFRSHDIFGASLANWYALAKLLGFVSKKVGAKPGTLTSVSCSAHIYERDFGSVIEMLQEGGEEEMVAKDHSFQMDPEGFFTIHIEDGQIVVRYHITLYPNGPGILKRTIKGKDPMKIYHTISRLDLISRYDHAAYLGVELEKAAICLKKGINYVQDSEIEF